MVIGLVETHGRRETEALVEGFEVIPRKPVVYVNRIMSEFDIDKALARRPSLLLIDELAHANIPGSRHLKRWQDVEELLAAGIDVWTTLNIQHLEGLNDIVQRITRVQVRETVPDRVFEEADDIVLVDLPTEELLKRLAEGKVYVEDMAARARKRFFKPENLTALRELTLRRAAERIDADLIDRMQAQAIEGPWAAGERILACIGPDLDAPMIVRAAKRLADLMDAPWIAVTVEKPGEPLGREGAPVRGQGAEAGSIARGRNEHARGQRHCRRAFALRQARERDADRTRSLARRLPDRAFAPLAAARARAPRRWHRRPRGDVAREGGWPCRSSNCRRGRNRTFCRSSGRRVAVAVAAAHRPRLTRITAFPNLSMIFLMAVVFAAVTFGIWPAIYASVLSFLAYNFLFIEPLYTFTVAQPDELLALVVFLAISVITSTLAGRVREQAQIAVGRMRATRRLYEFTRRLSGVAAFEDHPGSGCHRRSMRASQAPSVILIERERASWSCAAASPLRDALDTAAMTAARWAHQARRASRCGHGDAARRCRGSSSRSRPRADLSASSASARKAIGCRSIRRREPCSRRLPSRRRRHSIVPRWAGKWSSARSAAETERVRNTLLASISHDFRTPLASILGSATSLLEYGDKLDAKAQKELLGQIKTEAEDLDDMVRNLLAMTRIDAGVLEVRQGLGRSARAGGPGRKRGATARVHAKRSTCELPANVPLIRADARLIEQALGNAVTNAVAHTPAQTQVVIDAEVTRQAVQLRVTDDGPGIPEEMLPHVFEKFVHARRLEPGSADGGEGTGLGLTIAKGIMDAHGASIAAESPVAKGHGTRLIFTFPLEEADK